MKILIAVVSCHAYKSCGYRPKLPSGSRSESIRATWKNLVPDGVDFKFFLGRGPGTPKPDEVFLNVADEFFAAARKVQGIIRYAFEHGYDYVLNCADDVFVNVPAILKSDFVNYDYVGNATNPGLSKVPFRFCCGFAMWLSRKAMEIVSKAEVPWSDFEKEFDFEAYKRLDNIGKIPWHDDLWVGQVLSASGIEAHDDEHYIVSVCEDNGGPSTYPLDKAYAVHITPKFELMETLYRECLT